MAHSAQPLLTVELNEDVKRMVLEYISLYSDLRALCLVSQAWYGLSVQYLYANIVLDIGFDGAQVSLFVECLRRGASKHLRHARRLSLLDVRILDRPLLPWHVFEGKKLLVSALKMFPDDVLRVFRYLSNEDLDPTLLRHINKHQKSVHTIHAMRCDPSELIAPSRRNILVEFYENNYKTDKFVEFVNTSPQLESLTMLLSGGWTTDIATYWEMNSDIFSHVKLSTKELSMSGYMPHTFSSAVAHLFDYSIITKLTFFECNLWPFDDILGVPELCNVQYFQLATYDTINLENLKLFFERNQMLQHVYLSVVGFSTIPLERHNPTNGSSYLWPLHGRLKTLSLHDPLWESVRTAEDQASIGFPPHLSLKYICRKSCTLQQIGLQPPTQVFSSAERLLAYLKPLQLLKSLRIVHLYHGRLIKVDPSHARTEDEVAEDTRQVATRVFQDMRMHCPCLRVLIWGVHGELLPAEWESSSDEAQDQGLTIQRTAQHLFARREQIFTNGDSSVTATPVTRRQLLDEFPDLDMLAYDPGQHTLERLSYSMSTT